LQQHVYDQAATNFQLSRDGQATELETLKVDVYKELAECYDAWDALDLPKAKEKLGSVRAAVDALRAIDGGDEVLEAMFSSEDSSQAEPLAKLDLARQGASSSNVDDSCLLRLFCHHKQALDSLMEWITEEGAPEDQKTKKTKKISKLAKLRNCPVPGEGGQQDLVNCRSFFHVGFFFLEGAKRMQHRRNYDSASLFLYRLLEWIIQYRLAAKHGVFADLKDQTKSARAYQEGAYQQFFEETGLKREWLVDRYDKVIRKKDPEDLETLKKKRENLVAAKLIGHELQDLDNQIAWKEAEQEKRDLERFVEECK
jgi:hypothetical protein